MSDELSPQQLQSQAQTEHQDQAQNSSTGREDETTQRLATPITNQENHEAYPRERRHDRNVSFRHRRHQDLSPRFEDDRNIIYLNDLNTRHYRSQNLLSDPSAFWFQRSASARNIRLRSGVSHSHLHVDDRLTNQIRRSFHDRSNGLSQDTLVERQNVVLVPMYGLLRPRRSRNRSHRLSADLENPQRRQVELDIPGCRNLNNSLSSPMNDDVGDRPIIFTNPTNRTPLQQPLSLNTAQTLSLRSPNEGNSDCVSQIVRSQPRINSVQTSRTTQGVQTRGLYQGQLRRHQNDTTPHRYIDGGHVGHETFVMNCASNVSRSAGIHQNESGVVIPSNNSNGNNEQTTETVDTYDSPNISRDREIYVLRNIQSSSHPLQLTTIDNASMTTTSISDASSIEDLHVTEIIANSHNESVIHRPRLYESSNSNTEKISKRQEIKHSELRADVNDWRANLIGSRQLWRQMLITERFADVWFIVGGDDILGSNGTLSLHSNDPGAPGGPTNLNSDSEQPSGHSDHSIENKSSTNVNKSHDYNSQMIQLKDDKNQFKVNSSSKTNNSNYTHQIDNCTSNHNGSYQETNDTEPLVWRFAAHRLILAAASPVFEAMFYGPMADCDNKGSENRLEYHIPDIHPKAFQIMLSYIYSDELLVENDIDLLFYVLYATKKYILPRLTQICVEYLKDLITADNVCMMLDRSIFFDEVDLTRRCWHVIDVLAPDVLASQGLLTLNANCVHDLVSRNTLNCQESEVFAAVGRWAGAECIRLGIRDVVSNRVQVAANILPLIRFPTMTLSDFAENVAYSGYLSLEMVRDLFVYITTNKLTAQNKDVRSPTRRSNSVAVKKNDNSNELTENETTLSNPSVSTSIRLPIQSSQLTPNSLPDSGPFPREPRTGPKLYRCCRFKRIRKDLLSLTASNNHRHTISFSVSESIFIAGVGIYGSTQAGDIRTVHVELKSGNGSTPLLSPANPTPGGIQLSERIHFSHASRSTSDLTNLNASTRLFNNTNNNNGRYSNVWDNTALSRLDEGDSPNIQVNSTNHSSKKRSTKCLASKQISLRSDGTNRVYDIRFECPVKLIKNRRYYLCLNTSNGDHTASMSTSSTAINSSTSYIGFYGKTEILIHCPSEETLKKRELELKINKTSINIKKKQLELNNKSTYITNYNDNSHLLGNNETVIFNFHDSWDGLENGNVDRGLIPDLLFYTCF
ncbi:BTB/POZ domain-containing protein 1 [Schistosoma japonicum]|nr:BTB/POZ domain-containing protein 1 [Schistosoma japonicum]KAH8855972.1 BTB/POZ domain-containing protein 1 [Schistosoma japonicum]KAH8855974.1 BTB/POZ domain-containing protein 1 [Schistosoma japonicum]